MLNNFNYVLSTPSFFCLLFILHTLTITHYLYDNTQLFNFLFIIRINTKSVVRFVVWQYFLRYLYLYLTIIRKDYLNE